MATTCSTVLSWKGWGKDRRQRRQARRCTRPVKIRAQRGKKQEVEVGRRGWAEGSDKVTLEPSPAGNTGERGGVVPGAQHLGGGHNK